MKKLLIIGLITTCSFITVNAQTGVSFGLRAIPTFNWTTVSDTGSTYSYENTGTKLGLGFGPSLRFMFSDNFNVDISGIFTWQKFGIHQTNEITNPDFIDRTEDFKVQFLQIPLNLNGQFEIAGDFHALINFGLGTGIKIASSRVITDLENPNMYSSDYEKVSVLNFIDFYLTAGVGLLYNIEDNLHLSLTAQYNNGLLDGWLNSKNDPPSSIEELTLRHRNVALSLGFYIDL